MSRFKAKTIKLLTAIVVVKRVGLTSNRKTVDKKIGIQLY